MTGNRRPLNLLPNQAARRPLSAAASRPGFAMNDIYVEETGTENGVPERISVDQTPLEIPLGEDEPQLTSAADTTPEAAERRDRAGCPCPRRGDARTGQGV